MKYCAKALQEFPALLVRAGTTPFIHRSMLHAQGYPTILYDTFSACASYLTMSESTERVVFSILDIRTNQILQAPQSSSLLENLARIQALTLLQSIRLFNGNIRQRALAEAQDELFEQLILVLQAHLAGLNRDFESSWSGWIIAESVRRTLVTAYMLRGVYSLLKNGYCTLSPLVSQMSFTAQSSLWDARTESDWNRRRRNGKTYFVSCMDFSDIILSGTQDDLDDLGMMMLVTYRGYDSVMAWSQGQQEGVWAWA
ncbi:Zn(2)-C6 fungal-type domain-containing protein [Trichoderma simmonsii]|uniref:Zn(2)-C6 fungal-type domain-containing protein n=1 Tax=Trichoderma simmonsii TaxID=1491479 RepID=A0A8G0L8S3_9HYPO|nr:Zn(2)-C6 fungal-type domain-containing protein [Trichoderma simmonsii]